MIRKVAGFKISQARVEELVNHPDQDRALWALVESRCSWRGRLDATGFLLANGTLLEWRMARASVDEGAFAGSPAKSH